ncbi:glycosyltransferase family 10 domain-containing protein [Parasedimentitalea marina]|nr:glycosyltransferase family 10 [Parasedimentitalea marina]
MHNPIKTHVFTDVPERMFLKQSPGQTPVVGDVTLTFGLDIPDDIDVLIVFNRASYSLETTLPKGRTVFVAAEPDVIHPYSRRFLDQFGIVLTTTPKPLGTEKWHRSTCWYWFAGINFSNSEDAPPMRDHDWFSALEVPKKSNKISIVTSTKVHTDYHRKRMRFVETLIEKIPDHLEIYGRGFQSIDDKADAMLPCRYHLAIENGDGPHSWTEKLVDPWLCWAFPFYAGCDNVEDYFPRQSFEYLDLAQPEQEADRMIRDIQNGRWQNAMPAITEARQRVLEQHNLIALIGELATAAAQIPLPAQPQKRRHIWSERSLLPEKGCRGSLPEWAFRNTIMMFDPKAELKTVALRRWLEKRRTDRRAQKLAQLEDSR